MTHQTLLIVDDNADDRLAFRRLLHRNGGESYRIIESPAAIEGLRLAAGEQPACILLDYRIPDLSGVEFLTRLRQTNQESAVIVLTGLDDSRISVEFIKLGADDYLVKDRITGEDLGRAIRNAIHTRSLQRQLRQQRERLELFFRLVDQSGDALFVVDAASGRLIEANAALALQFGYPQGELLGVDYRQHRLFDSACAHLDRLREQAASNGEERFECDLFHSNGEPVPVEITAKRIEVGDGAYLLVVMRDITQRRAVEDHLRRLSLTDGLTGAFNRRAFDERLAEEWARAARSQTPLALLMFDVDHFKNYNDSLGHMAGDECLRQIVAALQHLFRRVSDHVSRYGGEEFIALLSQCGREPAQRAAESALETIRKLKLPHPASPVASYVTACVGVAVVVPHPSMEPSELVSRADAALYRAKNGGRDRVEIED
jgi:diguanylate cyclase (GGDEF)-like protein/PAS domain S-box-containing protein